MTERILSRSRNSYCLWLTQNQLGLLGFDAKSSKVKRVNVLAEPADKGLPARIVVTAAR
jgi:hypothetical protein